MIRRILGIIGCALYAIWILTCAPAFIIFESIYLFILAMRANGVNKDTICSYANLMKDVLRINYKMVWYVFEVTCGSISGDQFIEKFKELCDEEFDL